MSIQAWCLPYVTIHSLYDLTTTDFPDFRSLIDRCMLRFDGHQFNIDASEKALKLPFQAHIFLGLKDFIVYELLPQRLVAELAGTSVVPGQVCGWESEMTMGSCMHGANSIKK